MNTLIVAVVFLMAGCAVGVILVLLFAALIRCSQFNREIEYDPERNEHAEK